MDEYEETFAEWLVETVTTRTTLGNGPKGPVLSDPVEVDTVMVNYKRTMVRNTTTESSVSDAQITTPRRQASHFTVGGLVTLPDGQVRTVHSVAIDPPAVPLAHCRVVLV